MTFLLLTLANLKVSESKKMDDSSSEGSVDEEEILRNFDDNICYYFLIT